VVFGGIMRNVVAVDDVLRLLAAASPTSHWTWTYVVPIPLTLLQCVPLKLEASQPPTALL
jgi:hypothetical protein